STAKPFLERWMHDQIGWRGLLGRLEKEAPRYAQLLPELPRLVHQVLLRAQRPVESPLTRALLLEQRRTNRLLQALLWAALGFTAGALAVHLVYRVAAG
ncbi:MAG: ubiquinone biosynthesis regulatory protein kinase UbiB, partial [Rubrivivax sp.]|nr:ubiquinone biosynthesis regulatory protein kinase UbiB [Rubrivivax sp.]